MDISVIIPLYNEENILERNCLKILKFITRNFKYFEIILVNDGSSDTTPAITGSLSHNNKNIKSVSYKNNKGKGYAIQQGVKASKGEAVLFLDMDLSTPIEELSNLIPYLENYEVVIGSRALKQSQIKKKQKWYRVILGKMGNKIIQLLLLPGIQDTQCGFKLFRGDIARKIFPYLTIKRWGFDFEILYLAKKIKSKIKEIPVKWSDKDDSKLKLKDYLSTLFELFKIKWNNLRGKYKMK